MHTYIDTSRDSYTVFMMLERLTPLTLFFLTFDPILAMLMNLGITGPTCLDKYFGFISLSLEAAVGLPLSWAVFEVQIYVERVYDGLYLCIPAQ